MKTLSATFLLLLFAASAWACGFVSGKALGAHAQVDGVIVAGPVPQVVLPASGKRQEQRVLNINVPGILQAASIRVATEGTIGPGSKAKVVSKSIIENAVAADGLVTAQAIHVQAFASCKSEAAFTSADTTRFIDLTVGGVPFGDLAAPPNTVIDVPGFGVVILNEQTVEIADGHARLTVTAVRVLTGDADIVIGQVYGEAICK